MSGEAGQVEVARATAAQRRAADPEACAWVAASAGSGKTKVLTDRVVTLLLSGTPPTRLVCLTFTKAAAAEMANRLAARLATWATLDDEKLDAALHELLDRAVDGELRARARRLFAEVLEAPGGMKIQTIHAFCQSLLARFPLEAGIAPHFRVLDEGSAREMLADARSEAVAGGETDLRAALAVVASTVQDERLTALLEPLIGTRARLGELSRAHGGAEGAAAALYRALGLEPGIRPEEVLRAGCALGAVEEGGLQVLQRAFAAGSASEGAKAETLAAWLAAPPEARVERYPDYRKLFLTDKGEPRSRGLTKAAAAAEPEAAAAWAAEAARLLDLEDRRAASRTAEASGALLHLGEAVLKAYERRKGDSALLDYDDQILGARRLLTGRGAAAWVLYKLDGGLDHILVDEAQDTSPDQWAVVEALSEEFFAGEGARSLPRTLFAVGDAKQSIYGFQGADPRAFAEVMGRVAERARAAGRRWHEIDLDVSFRSVPAVLGAVDAVFAQDAARAGLLLKEGQLTHRPVRRQDGGRVELWPLVPAAEAEPPEPWDLPPEGGAPPPALTRLAGIIARRIWNWTAAPEAEAAPDAWLEARGRRVRPGDILILVRRRNALVEELVRALKNLGVPVAGVDRMVLKDHLAVMDLIALARVLLMPEDDLTLATVLKGPLVGLSEDALFTLAHGRKGSLRAALASAAINDPRFARAHEALSVLAARADYLRPYELFVEVLTRPWSEGGTSGRARLLARLGPEADDAIEEFLSLALAFERQQVPLLESFLHWVDVGAQVVKRDHQQGADAVRVMTVHGAKGLEAPIVILPDTVELPRAPQGPLWLSGGAGGAGDLFAWPPRRADETGPVAEGRAAQKRVQEEEYQRLLYVALTRAEDRLYVCGYGTRRAPLDSSWYRLVEEGLKSIAASRGFDLPAAGGPGVAGEGLELVSPQDAETKVEEPTTPPVPPAPALPDWALAPPAAEPLPPRPLAPSGEAITGAPVAPPLGRAGEAAAITRGRLIHRLLEVLPEAPPEVRVAAGLCQLAAMAPELSEADGTALVAQVCSLIEAPEFAALFGPGSRAEAPLVGLLGGGPEAQVVSGRVDRLVITAECVMVVDYKTGRPVPAHPEAAPVAYLRQMALYRTLLQRIFPGKSVECLLLWTETPSLMVLPGVLLDRYW